MNTITNFACPGHVQMTVPGEPWEDTDFETVPAYGFSKLPGHPVNYPPKDLDGYNFTILPRDLVELYGSITSVQLASHAPMVRDKEVYKNWMFIGSGPALFKVSPHFKELLQQQLQLSNYTIFLSSYPLAFIQGSQVVTMRELMVALQGTGCSEVRVQAYGMKQELDDTSMVLGDPEHPLAATNFWDLGRNFQQPHITLVKPKFLKRSGATEVYPMLLLLGKGHGTVKLTLNFRGVPFKIKIYPLLVHSLKACSGKQVQFDPTTLETCKKRETSLLHKLSNLETFHDLQLGGLRIEVTPDTLLNIHEWIQPTSPEMQKLQLSVRFISRARYFRQFKLLLDKARELGTFRGDKMRKTGPVRKKILRDLFNALGWNPGHRATSRLPPQEPWWKLKPSDKDLDELPQVQTSMLDFLDPQDPKVHHKEIQRCCKIFKRGKNFRVLILNAANRAVPMGSESTKEKMAEWVYKKYGRTWPTTCYLLEQPFRTSTSHAGTSNIHKSLDQELGKFTITHQDALMGSPKFHQLRESANYLVTSGYIKGDGNCQFRALSHAIYGHQGRFRELREEVVRHLRANLHLVEPVLAAEVLSTTRTIKTPVQYLQHMDNEGTWGDDLTLSTLVNLHKLSLLIINPDRSFFEVKAPEHPQTYTALYYTGNHYELVVRKRQ
ncbi:uncharacterized protein PSFLO_02855 [Pseudozyma flocculosa]|uniref:OTU domain-containing protein n=1 Tax=Pseudozyma flocculosa TaxID=84751 RepID=A0A5C3EZ79_9BASI|nr:uncharacterized protein PSFLO_02855 [Pseudozyma flocculosa]